MSVFLDTGVLVAYANKQDRNHDVARALFSEATSGEWGTPYTSDYVFDESVTLALARTRKADVAQRVGELLLGTGDEGRVISMAYVTPEVFLRSWGMFRRLAARGLSFTDCTSLELMRQLGVQDIASFDSDFDGLVVRRRWAVD